MALSTHDLRIGNWITDGNIHFQVTDLGEAGAINITYSEGGGHNWVFSEEDCYGIPLSADLLMELGFKESAEGQGMELEFNPAEWLVINNLGVHLSGDDKAYFTIDCKYIHQLQNLFHSLTGKELTYTNTSK